MTATGARRLGDLLRYVCAMELRLDKLPEHPHRDHDRVLSLHRLERELAVLRADAGPGPLPAELDAIAWMLEELRVSTFAQSLGTAFPVSEQRVQRALERAAAAV